MKGIYLEVRTGARVRDLLEMGLLVRLLERPDVHVVILTPAYRDPEFRARYVGDRVTVHELLGPGFAGKQYLNAFVRIRNSFFGKRSLFRLWLLLQPRLFPFKGYDYLFEQYPPSVVVGTDLANPSCAPLLLSGKARGAVSAGLMASWDHTYKPMWAYPDILAVWGEVSREEAIRLQGFQASTVHAIGAPQFDPYFEQGTVRPRDEFLRSIGLDPGRRTLLVATKKAHSRSDQRFLVEDLLAADAQGVFGQPIQIILRPHPGDRWAPYLATYRSNPLVRLDWPGSWMSTLDWVARREDVVHMANLLAHSDLVVHVASTVLIESAIFDTPSVIAGYHPTDPEVIARKLEGRDLQMHYASIMERDLEPIARSRQELMEWVRRYLQDRSLGRNERRILVREWVGPRDGRAVDRTGDLLLGLAEEPAHTRVSEVASTLT